MTKQPGLKTPRPARFFATALLFIGLALFAAACDSSLPGSVDDRDDGSGAGGATAASGAGGRTQAGGAASGGAPGAGGMGSGGSPNVGSGGDGDGPASGGALSAGGAPSVGGAAMGSSGGATSGSDSGSGGGSGAARSAGCGETSTMSFGPVPNEPPEGFGEGGYVTIQSSGESRGFAMRLPDNYDKDKPYWLIFGFHWNGGNSKEVDSGGSNGYEMAHFGLQKLSDNGAIFVAPQGNGNGWGNPGGKDLTFVDDMVKLITDNYCVDTTRLFANGFSYGGGMSYAIACDRADMFRGVAIYNGAVLSGCENGNDPIAYWQMAGLTDGTCTVGMGEPMRDRFIANNGCTPQDAPQPPPPPPYLSDGGHVCTDYQGCSSGHPLRWCVHQSGHGNAIVDGTADLWHSCATPPNSCSDDCKCSWVPGDVWSFFNSL